MPFSRSPLDIDDEFSNSPSKDDLYIPYLMLLGIIYCKAIPRERAQHLFYLARNELTSYISCKSERLKELFFKILEIISLNLSELYQSENVIPTYLSK